MAGEAQFSQYMAQFLAAAALTGTFTIRRRQVNVLKEETFPLLAVWADRSGIEGEASDDESQHETMYSVLVAARLAADEPQDEALGRLIKVVMDAAETFGLANVEFEVGDWETDSGTEEGEGSKVWAEFPIVLRYRRPRGNF